MYSLNRSENKKETMQNCMVKKYNMITNKPRHENHYINAKTMAQINCAVTAKLISASKFVFAL